MDLQAADCPLHIVRTTHQQNNTPCQHQSGRHRWPVELANKEGRTSKQTGAGVDDGFALLAVVRVEHSDTDGHE
jgi:hypothetical protein